MKNYSERLTMVEIFDILSDHLAFRKGLVLRYVEQEYVFKALKKLIKTYRTKNKEVDSIDILFKYLAWRKGLTNEYVDPKSVNNALSIIVDNQND